MQICWTLGIGFKLWSKRLNPASWSTPAVSCVNQIFLGILPQWDLSQIFSLDPIQILSYNVLWSLTSMDRASFNKPV